LLAALVDASFLSIRDVVCSGRRREDSAAAAARPQEPEVE
jgi:hypothetical protein